MPERGRRTVLGGVAVVVPVHDEEELLGRCLTSVTAACGALAAVRPDIAIRVVVVLDSCRDTSGVVAAGHDVDVVTIAARLVGRARRVGVERARVLLPEVDVARTWLACTDADSEVPRDWLIRQVRAGERGARLVLGRVRPDPLDLDRATRRAWRARHRSRRAGAHVHGANLGVRLDAYLDAGSFASVAEHEDIALVAALAALGVRAVAGGEVLTSGRGQGRVSGGFSGYLRRLGAPGANEPVA